MIHVILFMVLVTANVKLKVSALVVPTVDTEIGSGDIDGGDFIQNVNTINNSTMYAVNTTEQRTSSASSSTTASHFWSATESSVTMTTTSKPTKNTSISSTTFTLYASSNSNTTSTANISTYPETFSSTDMSVSGNETSTQVASSSESTTIISSASPKLELTTPSDETATTSSLNNMTLPKTTTTTISSVSNTQGSNTSDHYSTKESVISTSSESNTTTPYSSEHPKRSTDITEHETTTLRYIITELSTELETSTNTSQYSTENEGGGNSAKQNGNVLLAVILPLVFVVLLAAIIGVGYMIRKKRRKKIEVDQDSGYVLKRQRSFSNPAFREQNMDTLAYQLNNRDSVAPSALRNNLHNYGNIFGGMDLKEEDTNISDQTDGKEGEVTVVESSFKRPSVKKSSFKKSSNKPEFISNDLQSKSETSALSSSKLSLDPEKGEASRFASLDRVPPLPGKGQKNTYTVMNSSSSDYDVLPQRESLPIKQRRISAQSESNSEAEFTTENPQYDILPLRTFCTNQASEIKETDAESAEHISMSTKDIDSVRPISVSEEVNGESNSQPSTSQSENNFHDNDSGVFAEKEDQFENDAIERIKSREPATRAPSFVVLPRAPSGSMRTAL